jgi:hypothetical protein
MKKKKNGLRGPRRAALRVKTSRDTNHLEMEKEKNDDSSEPPRIKKGAYESQNKQRREQTSND